MSTVAASTRPATAASKPRSGDGILASPKMVAIMVLGAASGFPNQITESGVAGAGSKDCGASNTDIGAGRTSRCRYLLKFQRAPAIDRYPLPLLGRRRGWVALMQLCLARGDCGYSRCRTPR